MSLFCLAYDSENYYIEAPSMTAAIGVWKDSSAKYWGDDWDGTEEPDSCALVDEGAVIRGDALLLAATEVMELLSLHGPGIVGHLMDSDENAGQRLRDAIVLARGAR